MLYCRCFLVLLCMFVMVSCIQDDIPEAEERVMVGDVLPSFVVKMNTGETVSSFQFEGKTGVIVFFNTDCPDCRKELPVIQRLYDRYRENDSVMICCISREEGESQVDAYWREAGLSMPYSAQEDRSVYELFCTVTIPRIYIVGPDLVIRAVYTDNPLPALEELEAAVGACL